jgi:hypothetical protein
MIPRPTKVKANKDGSVLLEFPWEAYNGKRDGRYYVKGAISFPVYVEHDQKAEGWVIVAAQEVKSGEVVVLTDTKWYCVDTEAENDTIIHQGLDGWFSAVWSAYACRTFYHSDKLGTHQQYMLQIIRNDNIEPKPWLCEVQFYDQENAINNLYAWRTRGKLIIDESSRLMGQLLLWEQTGRKQMLPAVQALLTLMAAYERYPYRKMEDE